MPHVTSICLVGPVRTWFLHSLVVILNRLRKLEMDHGELRDILNFQFGVHLNYFKMTGYFQQLFLKDNIGITWRK